MTNLPNNELVTLIADMLDSGMSVNDVAKHLDEQAAEEAEMEIEARAAADEDEMMHGHDEDDGLTSSQREYHDRLSYGRNDAGEWRGFM
jgi:hypothetical protein